MAVIESGNDTAGKANVNDAFQLQVALPTAPAQVGGVRNFSENDDGTVTGSPYLKSPETDDDFRLRVSQENLLDNETFNYTAQNTGKFNMLTTTMAPAFNAAGFSTNGSGITTIATGMQLRTYAYFPLYGSMQSYVEIAASFTNQPTTDTIIDFGLFISSGTNPYTPTDGVYFRLTSAGLAGVINSNGSETNTGLLGFTYITNQKYKFLIVLNETNVEFWIDNVLYAMLSVPAAQGQPFMASSLPFAVRHAITGGAAGSVLSMILNDYYVSLGGSNATDGMNVVNNRILGSYQGLSGGVMGSLASYANSANPTAAIPTNTTSAVLTALGGQGWETDTLAAPTDGVIMSYQIPAGTANVQGRRLRLNGVTIHSYVQTALTGGGYNAQLVLAFGHTAVSLATAEAATTKAPRRIPIGSYSVASGLAVLTQLPTLELNLQNPVYVNPGEFIAIVKKKVGTAPSIGVIAHMFTLDYSWE
jgi:hypothetical protein